MNHEPVFGIEEGAKLIVDEGEILLVVTRHEHRYRTVVEAYPLQGSDVGDLVRLLATLGFLPTPAQADTRAVVPPPVDQPAVCDQCERSFANPHALRIHQARAHQPKPQPPPAPEPPRDACEICGVSWSVHPRCAGCEVGVGPGHATLTLIDGRCLDCHKAAQRRKQAA